MRRAVMLMVWVLAMAPGVSQAQVKKAEVEKVMAWFDHEPGVVATQQAALRHVGIDQAQMRSWAVRSRWSHLAPEALEGRAQIDRSGEGRRVTREDLDVGYIFEGIQTTHTTSDEGQWRAALAARWNLSRLVFDPEELSVAAERARQTKRRSETLEEVTEAYFARRRLQIQALLLPPQSRVEAVSLQLDIDALSAVLDLHTGGWFTRSIRKRVFGGLGLM